MCPEICVEGKNVYLTNEEAKLVSTALLHERVNRVIEAQDEGKSKAAVCKVYGQTQILKILANVIRQTAG